MLVLFLPKYLRLCLCYFYPNISDNVCVIFTQISQIMFVLLLPKYLRLCLCYFYPNISGYVCVTFTQISQIMFVLLLPKYLRLCLCYFYPNISDNVCVTFTQISQVMFVLLLSLLGVVTPAVIDPSLTEWKLLETNEVRELFPLRDYILEVKAFLPDVYDTNPPYGELFRTDKATTMMMILHAGSWSEKVGRLVWNTIKYDRGYDVGIEECDVRYEAYNSFPAGGKKEQIWAWNFFDDYVELTCDDELQYSQNFNMGDFHSRKPGLPEQCRALGDAQVDRIIFRHMEGFYIRGRPKSEKKETTQPVAELTPTQDLMTTQGVSESPSGTPELDEINIDEEVNTCNCWIPECGYCNNPECAVQQDLSTSSRGIQVTSQLGRAKMNSLLLFDQDGKRIGYFRWSLRSIFLTGCIGCPTPGALRRARAEEGPTTWTFSLQDAVMKISVGGEVLYEQKLVGECRDAYLNVRSYSFYDTTCEDTFTYIPGEMVPGLYWDTQPAYVEE